MHSKLTKQDSILIATLGTEPQVVTATLDLLRDRGENISHLQVIHTQSNAPTSIQISINTLQDALRSAGIQFKFIPLASANGIPLEDVDTPEASAAFFRLLYRLVRQAKEARKRVHLSIAGGRKTMAVFGMVTAQLLFEPDDCLWHLFSAGDFLTSKRLHPGPDDDVHLVAVPVILWSQVSPVISELHRVDDPFVAIERIRSLQLAEQVEAGRSFVFGSLTPAERRVVEMLVREGLSDQELAQQLNLSPRTVEQHLRSAYAKASDHWELEENPDRLQLASLLHLYYATQITENPA
jgi:CRISPR-associated Csx14 family protein